MRSHFVKSSLIIYSVTFIAFAVIGCQTNNKDSQINIESDSGSSEFYSGEKPEISNTSNDQPSNNTQINSCPGAPPQRVKVGDRAFVSTISDRVIVRKDGNKNATEIARIHPGTYFYITGGPKCDQANNWTYWKIETDNGLTGWISEGGDSIDYYFISPAN